MNGSRTRPRVCCGATGNCQVRRQDNAGRQQPAGLSLPGYGRRSVQIYILFWQRTMCSDAVRARYRKRGRIPPPPAPANAEADFADAATVAQIMEGVPTPEGMRLLRRQAMERIENSGTVRRIARSAAKRARIRANVHDAEQQHIGDVDV